MTRILLSIPSVPNELSNYSNLNEIAELLGVSIEQGDEPNILFEKGKQIYKLCGLSWENKEQRKFWIMQQDKGSLQFEDPNREIEELKSANKVLGNRCDSLMREKENLILRLKNLEELEKELISKDLFLQAISAATGKILK